MKDKIELDCFGDICPVPMIKTQKALEDILIGESVLLITDHSCVVKSIEDRYGESKRVDFDMEEVMNGVWEIRLIKKA